MKNLFTSRGTDNRLLSTLLMLLVALWTVPHYSNAMNVQAPDGEDECVLELKTAGSAISFYVGTSDAESGSIKVDFGGGTVEDYEIGKKDTIQIEGNVSEGSVKVYGSRTLIRFLYCPTVSITNLNVSNCENLEVLNCNGNGLSVLDLTKNSKLYYLDCGHNLLTELDVTHNPALYYIDCQGNDLLTLDITKNEGLIWLYAQTNFKLGNIDFSNNKELREILVYGAENMTTIDVTNIPHLLRLAVDMTSLSTIDVSKNPELQILNVGYTKITTLDISKNTKLRELYFSQKDSSPYKFKTIDVSNNPELIYLFGMGNELTEIDLSNNSKLFSIYLTYNNIKNLDVSNCKDLAELIIRSNRFTFNTLPLPHDGVGFYDYSMQKNIEVEREHSVSEPLDLSKDIYSPDYETTVDVYLYNPNNSYGGGERLVAGEDYTFDKGVVKFLKTQEDSVYCTFRCDAYPSLSLSTTRFMVLNPEDMGKSTLAAEMTTGMAVGETFAMNLATFGKDEKVEIDFGDGELKEFTLSDTPQKVSGEVKGANIKVYTASGVQLKDFDASGMKLSSVNINKSRALNNLNLNNNDLTEIDLSNNFSFRTIQLDNNKFTTLSVKGLNNATSFSCDNNLLESIVFESQASVLTNVSCSGNKLKDLSFLSRASFVEVLDCSHNEISDHMFVNLSNLRELNISYNKFKEVNLQYNAKLEKLNVEGNYFTYSTLPQTTAQEFVYGNQGVVTIAEKSFMIDFSKEATFKGKNTKFTWKKESGNVLEENVDYSIENGITTFLKVQDEKVYAELTNEAYPDLTLTTTLVETSSKPQEVLATMTASSEAGTEARLVLGAKTPKTVYVDFGDNKMVECRLENGYSTLTAQLGENKQITIYGYDESYYDITILSLSDVALKKVDISKLKDLSTLTFANAGLNEIDLNNNILLRELTLSGCDFAELDLSKLTELITLTLNSNNLSSIDISNNKKLTSLFINGNNLEELVMPELPELYKLNVSNNKLKALDVTNCPVLRELYCNGNNLTSIDMSGQTGKFSMVYAYDNNFKFSTLPSFEIYSMNNYKYYPQKDVEITVDGGKVDLSSEYMVAENPTVYTWTTESGATLVEGTDYTIDNGVTTFMKNFDENVYCSMTNAAYPELTLKTIGVKPETTGIGGITSGEGIKVENGNIVITVDGEAKVLVYNTAGMMVRSFDVEGGTVVVDGLAGGVYMIDVRCGSQRIVKKVMLK